MNEKIINRELLGNFVGDKTFTGLNLNKNTKFEKINYIFKKQMIIFFFKDYIEIKMVIHSLSSYNKIELINLKFIFNDYNGYMKFRTKFKLNNSQKIIEFLNNLNIFNSSEILGEYNNNIFFELYNESKYVKTHIKWKLKKILNQ